MVPGLCRASSGGQGTPSLLDQSLLGINALLALSRLHKGGDGSVREDVKGDVLARSAAGWEAAVDGRNVHAGIARYRCWT